jgi:putative transposase
MKETEYQKGHAALRKGRESICGQRYFITVCCMNRKPLMAGLSAAQAVCREFHVLAKNPSSKILAWVVMPDHLHYLLELTDQPLHQVCGRIHYYLAKAVNRSLKRCGARVWQGAYFDHAIRKDENYLSAIRYMLNNPVRAGLVDRIEDYPFWNIVGWDGCLWFD